MHLSLQSIVFSKISTHRFYLSTKASLYLGNIVGPKLGWAQKILSSEGFPVETAVTTLLS